MANRPKTATRNVAAYRARLFRGVLEYLGMVAAMLAGMVVLGLLRDVVAPGPALRADLETMIMATEMVIGMAAWMIARRHAWRGIAVMSAAMYLPFLVLAPLLWVGAISAEALGIGGHLLMLVAMALAMPLTHRTGHGAQRAQHEGTAR
ncbi:MAG: hypothetical protein JWR33_1952 [Naasia sp.]|uniref:hypothetical protein n=1 Tax=Naasia sp. TaxID=2546198 RepID=UPI0026104A34|nr:hypothetical protein [Naasia sp.]MCU1571211.1 hypothetical protein [Naasia sp.]